jgi:hypothetical protein
MVALMSGILSLFREVFLINHPEKAANAYLFWRCVFIAFIVSAIWLWVAEHQQVLSLQTKLDALTLPSLKADINIAYGPIGKDNQDTMMTIAGLIKNSGAPTIVDQWRAEIRFDDGTVISGQIPLAPKPADVITSSDRDGKHTIQMSGADWWPRKTRSSPIVDGGGADGWMFVFFPVLAQDIHDKKATVVLYCRDINAKEWPFQYKLEGQTPAFLNLGEIPGVKIEPLRPQK